MKNRRFFALISLGALGLVIVGLAYAGYLRPLTAQASAPARNSVQMGSTHFGLDWNVLGTGGGEIASTHFRVNSTIGQPATGNIDSTHFDNHAGYWQSFLSEYHIYLPLVLRST